MWRGPSIAVAAILLLVLVVVPSPAQAVGGTHVLMPDEHLAIEIDTTDGSGVWGSYSFRVVEGPPMNAWVMEAEGYGWFRDANATAFPFFLNWSVREAYSGEVRFALPGNGTYYVVFDNLRNADRGQRVRFEYSVRWAVPGTHDIAEKVQTVVYIAVLFNVLIAMGIVSRMLIDHKKRLETEDAWLALGEEDGSWLTRLLNDLLPATDDDASGWDPSRSDVVD